VVISLVAVLQKVLLLPVVLVLLLEVQGAISNLALTHHWILNSRWYVKPPGSGYNTDMRFS